MNAIPAGFWSQDLLVVALMFGLGLWCIVSQRNMIKILIGIELLARGVTLCLIAAGFGLGGGGVAQAMTIVVITLDAAVVAVALALVVNARRHYGAIDTRRLTRLRG